MGTNGEREALVPSGEHRYSWRKVEGENAANKMKEREKKEYLISLRMNNNSTVWASYCSKA
jgi:hypothetical protein